MNDTESTSSPGLSTDSEVNGAVWFFAGLFVFCMASDMFIIYIIRKTPTLQSYTGWLLVSQIIADICIQLISCLMLLPRMFPKSEVFTKNGFYTTGLLVHGFRGITSQTLSAMNLNLYFAICHSSGYRRLMSKRYVAIFIPTCWIFNIFVCVIPMASNQTRRSMFIQDEAVLRPSYEYSTLWAWITIVINCYGIPTFVTGFTFIQVYRYSQKVQMLTNANFHYREKYKLARIITGLSAWCTSVWTLLHVFRALQAIYEVNTEGRGIFQNLSLGTYVVNLTHDTFKLAVFVGIYKPIRQTFWRLFKRNIVTPHEDRGEETMVA